MNDVNETTTTGVKDPPTANTWGVGQKNQGYHRGFANVMKLSVILQAFVAPLLVWIVLGMLVVELTNENGLGVAATIIGYAVTAFSLWFSLSYKAKLFDNISKLAENSEQILKKMTQEGN